MIFNNNMTALGASNIPMAEGYDCSYGTALALVETARNDYAVFKAMVQADYNELAICRESTGVVREGEISALHEAVGGGIFKKIAEFFKKLIAKIKSIFATLIAKLRSLTMKDAEYVKKYEKELVNKSNLGKLEVKWRKVVDKHKKLVDSWDFDPIGKFSPGFAINKYDEDSWTRVERCIDGTLNSANGFNIGVTGVSNSEEITKEVVDSILENEDTLTLDDIGGWRTTATFLKEHHKKLTTMNSSINKTTKALDKLVNHYNKKASDLNRLNTSNSDDKNYKYTSIKQNSNEEIIDASDENNVNNAEKEYQMSVAFQTVILATIEAIKQVSVINYRQNKAAFVKAVTVNPKKLEESTYLDAVVEAAEEEVDAVIGNALKKEELSDLCSASKNVIDGDVCNNPYKLTGEPNDYYSDDADMDTYEGSINSTIGGGKVEESYFGQMFY